MRSFSWKVLVLSCPFKDTLLSPWPWVPSLASFSPIFTALCNVCMLTSKTCLAERKFHRTTQDSSVDEVAWPWGDWIWKSLFFRLPPPPKAALRLSWSNPGKDIESYFFLFFKKIFIYLAASDLSYNTGHPHCVMQDLLWWCRLSSWDTQTPAWGLSSCSTWAKLLCSMWALRSPPRNWAHHPCIARWTLHHWALEKSLESYFSSFRVNIYLASQLPKG